MKLLFIQEDVFKKYGTMVLSAIIKKNGHQCDILINSLEKNLIEKIRLINPDIIGFSIPSSRHSWMKSVAKEIKLNFNKPIIVGGPHPTFFPEIINENFIDFVCIGEGEKAILELLDKLENKQDVTKIKNIWAKKEGKVYKNPIRNLIRDLDSLPFADRELYLKYPIFRNQNIDIFMATRGCPYNCTFCFNKGYNKLYEGKGKMIRKRSVSSIIDEIKTTIGNNKKITTITFYDDVFILGPIE